jgi:predicted nucleotidyltransferase
MGRAASSALAPFLRSEALGRVLAAILLADESLHLRAIADRAQLPYSVVQREVDRLEETALVTSTRFGNARVVRPNEQHLLYDDLRRLLLKAYGPREVIRGILSDIPGIEEAFIFGSWAARYTGEWGASPEDIDVLVVGDPPRDVIDFAQADGEDALGLPVQITVVSEKEWGEGRTGFVRTVKQRPLVALG